jgi:hypothetical protein
MALLGRLLISPSTLNSPGGVGSAELAKFLASSHSPPANPFAVELLAVHRPWHVLPFQTLICPEGLEVRSCPNFGQFPLSTSKPPRGRNAGQIFGQSSADPRGRTSGRSWVGSASTASSPAVSLIYSLGPLQRVSLPRDRHYSRCCSCPSQFLAEQDFTVFAISACSSRTVSSSRAVCSSQFSAATVSARQPCREPAVAGTFPCCSHSLVQQPGSSCSAVSCCGNIAQFFTGNPAGCSISTMQPAHRAIQHSPSPQSMQSNATLADACDCTGVSFPAASIAAS